MGAAAAAVPGLARGHDLRWHQPDPAQHHRRARPRACPKSRAGRGCAPRPLSRRSHGSRPAPSRRADGKARVRAGILSAARRLFARQGVAETTMDDIARVAGVSRPTVFNYFPSKNLLLAALVHEMESRFLNLIEAQFDEPGSAAQRIAALFSWTAAKVEESAGAVARADRRLGDHLRGGARLGRAHRAHASGVHARARRRGGARATCGVTSRPTVLAEIVGGTYAGILHAWRVGTPLPAAAPPGCRRGHARAS